MELVASVLVQRYTFTDLFITPYILMKDRPEVYTFKKQNKVFIVESGTGGIMGHAHPLEEALDVKPVNNGFVYFRVKNEYMHSHPDEEKVYYIGMENGEYAIFEYDTKTVVTRSDFGAGHYHGLHVREVITIEPNLRQNYCTNSDSEDSDTESDTESDCHMQKRKKHQEKHDKKHKKCKDKKDNKSTTDDDSDTDDGKKHGKCKDKKHRKCKDKK